MSNDNDDSNTYFSSPTRIILPSLQYREQRRAFEQGIGLALKQAKACGRLRKTDDPGKICNRLFHTSFGFAQHHCYTSEDLADRMTAAATKILECLSEYDLAFKTTVCTFMYKRIKGAIREERVKQGYKLKCNKTNSASLELDATNDKFDADNEAEREPFYGGNAGYSTADYPASLCDKVRDGESEEARELQDTLANEDEEKHSPETAATNESTVNFLRSILKLLNSREQEVIDLYYGLRNNKPQTFAQISEQKGLAQATVWGIVQTSLKKLRKVFPREAY